MPSGISPLAFPGRKDAVIKVNSYMHDEAGITSEEAALVMQMTKKRLRKWDRSGSGDATISRCQYIRCS